MNPNESPVDPKIAGLFSYPVKGCRGVTHAYVDLQVSGLSHDREWMVVDTRHSPARFLSQRECALMATITASASSDDGLFLSSADGDTLVVAQPPRDSLIKVKVWSHETVALDAGDRAAAWFAAKLGMRPEHIRLVQFHPDMRRDCHGLYAANSVAHTLFADGYPLLVTSTASLVDLNRRMQQSASDALPMDRFRPNIVLDGLPPWDEDYVDALTVGEIQIRLVKPCVRCEVTTTDQASGARIADEPLRTLAKFRNNPDFGGVTFGWNAIVVKPGRISMADRVTAEYRF